MSGIVWPPRWACRFGSQAYGGQVVLLLDVVSWHSIFDSDRCWHHDAWLLFEARVLTWNGRISDEIWISTLCDCNLGLKTLKLVRQLCYFFVLDVCCVGIRLSQCPSRRAIILQDAASEPSESLDSFAITWKVTRLNDIFGQPLGVTPDLWTPWNARGGELDDIEAWVKTAVDGGTRFAHGTCCLYIGVSWPLGDATTLCALECKP